MEILKDGLTGTFCILLKLLQLASLSMS